jgi:hypothetical protein
VSESLKNAKQGILDVRFTPSPADLKVLLRADPNRSLYIILTVLSRIGAFAAAAGLTGLVLWASGLFAQDPLQHLSLSIAGGLAGITAFRVLVESIWRKRIRRSLFHPARPLHITSDGQALEIEDAHIKSRIAFSGIDRLITSPTHLVLFQDHASVIVLPKAAFEKPEVFDAFASFMQARVAAHHTRQSLLEKTS